MILITGPLYSGKRTFARTLPGRCIADAQQLAAGCKDPAELEKLADKLSAYDIVLSTEVGGITGDLAGWFLQQTELWMLAALCACQWGGLL